MCAFNDNFTIEYMLKELNIEENRSSFSQADTQGSESGNRTSHFSQLVMSVPTENNAFCLTLLWTLKERGMVLNWHWEEGILQVWADTDLILSRTSVPDGVADSWLLRLIEATQPYQSGPCQYEEDFSTDFSFLSSPTMLQSV